VNTAGVKLDMVDDKMFAREARKKGYKSAAKFFTEEKPKSGVSEVRKAH